MDRQKTLELLDRATEGPDLVPTLTEALDALEEHAGVFDQLEDITMTGEESLDFTQTNLRDRWTEADTEAERLELLLEVGAVAERSVDKLDAAAALVAGRGDQATLTYELADLRAVLNAAA